MTIPEQWYEDEVREGFYVPAMMKHSWAAQISMLERFDTICMKHGLRWFAAFGTLLGAVRHKGFVPWDDDLDLFMSRQDVERLTGIMKNCQGQGLWLLMPEEPENVDRGVALCWRFFNARGIELLQPERWEENRGFPFGESLDIFALDEINPDPEIEGPREEILSAIIGTMRLEQIVESSLFAEKEEEEQKEILDMVERSLALFGRGVPGASFDRDRPLLAQLIALMEKVAAEASIPQGRMAEEVAEMFYWCDKGVARFPASCFQNRVSLSFEGIKVFAPQDYVPVLDNYYGQWRTPLKAGGMHNYPTWGGTEEQVKEALGSRWPFLYAFDSDAMKEPERSPAPAEAVGQRLALLRKIHILLPASLKAGERQTAAGLLAQCQCLAQQAGETLEQCGSGSEAAVALLEQYCEDAYAIYQGMFGSNEGEQYDNFGAMV